MYVKKTLKISKR